MTTKEIKTLERIPKKYRKNIVELTITKSGYYNEQGRELNDYTVEWNNGDTHTFSTIEMMIHLIREYDINGYYVGA